MIYHWQRKATNALPRRYFSLEIYRRLYLSAVLSVLAPREKRFM